MADSPFSLNKLLSALKSFLSKLGSPIQGFDLQDAKVKQDGDVFSSLFTLEAGEELRNIDGSALTDVGGNPIPLHVLMRVVNFRSVFEPIFSGLNKLNVIDAARSNNELLNMLLGKERINADGIADNTLAGAKERGSGLLGFDLTDPTYSNGLTKNAGTYANKTWDWGNTIAGDYLKYSLECHVPNKDYGAIENVALSACRRLIGEYLAKMNAVTSAEEVDIDVYILVIPILNRMQVTLCEYYEAAYKKYLAQDSDETENPATEEPSDTPEDQQTSTEAPQSEPNAEAAPQEETPAMSAKHIDVTLQKIAGTTDFNMTAIKANYDPSLVLEDMDEIIGQPEFIDALPEEPTTYSIDVDDDGFDIEPCEECMEANPCEGLCEVFKAGIRAYRNLYIIHWMARGVDMMKLHTLAEELYGELIQEIDVIGELLVEKQGTVPQLDFPCDYVPVEDYVFLTGLEEIKYMIQMYVDCIDYAYCNQDSDVQSTLDEWLRYWKKQLNYFVERQEN